MDFSIVKNTAIKNFIIILLLSFCFFIPILSVIHKSPMADERRHFYQALRYLANVHTSFKVGPSISPPLEALNALPLIFLKVDFSKDIKYFYNYLFWARCVTPFFTLLLAFFVYRWARELYGEKAGVFALALYTFCPNILAHSALMTTDVPFTSLSFIWFYYFWKTINSYSYKNILLCSLFFGLALISKFNFLMFIPIYLFTGLLVFLTTATHERKIYLGRIILLSVVIIFIGSAILNFSYYFNYEPFPLSKVLKKISWIGNVFPFFGNLEKQKIMANIFLPIPYNYLRELECVIDESHHGHPAFLMGCFSNKGWLYYYLVAFFIKTPIPVLIFLILSIYSTVKNPMLRDKSKIGEYFLWIPPLCIFLMVSLQHCQIGIRHILPVYPFIFVIMSRIVYSEFMKKKNFRIFFAVLITWLIFSSVSIFPHYIAYFNELMGGPNQGYKYLLDSNLDWGQDLLGLKNYMEKNKIKKIKLSYFGNTKPEYYNIEYEELSSGPTTGFIAVSANHLQGIGLEGGYERYLWLKKYKPIAKIGYSIFVYDIK